MRRGRARKTGQVAVLREKGLDLPLPQRPSVPGEERRAGTASPSASTWVNKKLTRPREKGAFGPRAALQSLHHDARADEVRVGEGEQGHLRDAEAVEVEEGEERAVPWTGDHTEERPHFLLGEITGQALGCEIGAGIGRSGAAGPAPHLLAKRRGASGSGLKIEGLQVPRSSGNQSADRIRRSPARRKPRVLRHSGRLSRLAGSDCTESPKGAVADASNAMPESCLRQAQG